MKRTFVRRLSSLHFVQTYISCLYCVFIHMTFLLFKCFSSFVKHIYQCLIIFNVLMLQTHRLFFFITYFLFSILVVCLRITQLQTHRMACCLITGRRPERTSWVAPGVRVMHGHGGGLTTIGAGAGVAVGREDDSPRSHSLWSKLGFSLPPLTIHLGCLARFPGLVL